VRRALCLAALALTVTQVQAATILIRGATVHTMSHAGVLKDTDILIRDGRVAELGSHLGVPAEAEVIELPAKRFFMLTLFQPQIGALAGKPLHPLLREFVRCARQHAAQTRGAGAYP